MINNKNEGFGRFEILTVFVLILLIASFLLAKVFKSDYKKKYDVMQYSAKMFDLTANNVFIEKGSQWVYTLQMLIDINMHSNIKNPFSGEKYCNPHTSKVEFENDGRYVTLECGDYLIYKQESLASFYTIYQTSKWSDKKRSNDNQQERFYNYEKSGKKVFSDYLEEVSFIYEYNKKNSTNFTTIKEIKENEKVLEKTMYRHIEKVR